MVIYPILIIGAGPAGIATAVEALNRGYAAKDILLLEKSGEIAHMIATKYPEEKPVLANYKERMAECLGDLCVTDMGKADFLAYLGQVAQDKALNIQFHQQVQKIVKLRNGQFQVHTLNDTYVCDTVFVAIGNMSAPRTLGVPVDQTVAERIRYDLQQIKLIDKKVLVVGGGDSAGEYAKILVDRGHEVVLSYRKSDFERMLPQNKAQTEALIAAGSLKFYSNSNLSEVGSYAGKAYVSFQEDRYAAQAFDAIVAALGTERPDKYLNSIGIETQLESGELFSESKLGGLFFVGDLASGKQGGSINFAFNSGVKAMAQACSLYLDCQ